MREPWVREHFGPEVNARPGFERELADDLSTAWHAAAAGRPLAGPAADQDSDDVWAITAPERSAAASASPPPAPRVQPVPLQRRQVSAPQPTRARGALWAGIAVVAAAAAITAFVVRQQSDDNTAAGTTGATAADGGTLPGGATVPGGAAVPGQTVAPGDSTGTGSDGGTTTVAEGTAAGTQYMSPACFETRPTTAIPAAIDPAILEGGVDETGDPTSFRIQLPSTLDGATFSDRTDVRVVPGGLLVKASLTLADGTGSDTMLSVINNDGVVRWTRCFTNAYTLGPFGENGDGSITIWVARNTTDLARYVDLATGETSDLLSGYTGSTTSDGTPNGLMWSIGGNVISIWLPPEAAVGPHEVTLP